MSTLRISNQPAYVLHRYDWSESSLILEVFTRDHGRLALVARGAKKPHSSFRPVLLPLQALHIAFGGQAEIRSLKKAEWQGGHVMPTGDALLSGYYLNELLLRLLAREDPHPRLFDAYAATVQLLAHPGDTLQAALRAFELRLLRDVGFLPDLGIQNTTLSALEPHVAYVLVPQAGLREAHDHDRHSLLGRQWQILQQTLGNRALFTETLYACTHHLPDLKMQLRALLHYHCDGKTLKTQQLMKELQAL